MEKYQFPPLERTSLEQLMQPFAVYQFVDKKVVTLILSDGFCKLFGYEDRSTAYYDMDNNMYKDTHPDDVARIANAALRFATKGGKYEVIYRSKIKDSNEYRIIHAYGEHVFTKDGVRLAHVWYSDEGVYKESFATQGIELTESLSNALHENSMVKASQYDYLTGLPSMSYFFELAEIGRDRILENGGTPVFLYTDFSGMKFFNTRYGFLEGNRLLRTFAKVLADIFGNEHCCRFSSDHFAIQTEKEGFEERLNCLLSRCKEMNKGKNLPVHIGIYVAEDKSVFASVACDRAKLACSALYGKYETATKYYSQNLSEDASKRQYVIENIDLAIKEKWIQMYLQPIIRAVNGRVCDVEALARWIDPEKGFLSPADFIPALEEAGLIYKLDLYMVDQILESMKKEQEAGFYVVPHSINLSRSDFDACDIVEEIRKRVDEAHVDRSLVTIEITESIIGRDFEFMKEHVEKFRKHGFPVWMDDFGSGYSSLDVLQSIPFDLIKFDMSFLRKLDEGEAGKIILTELMKMATSLGLDTVCEGVETEDQVRFLREIGCSKLQGFYFSKPVPFETLKELRKNKTLILRENPEESEYYERIGKVNLFDLSFLANMDDSVFDNTFDTVPMGIMEINEKGDKVKYVRSNPSFRDFFKRAFGFDLSDPNTEYDVPLEGPGSHFMKAIEQSEKSNSRAFVDEKIKDGATARSFVRILGKNPANGSKSVAIAVLSINEPSEAEVYRHKLEEAQKIDSMNHAITSLLNNIPGMVFTKDAKTGVYLNCNQAFADYAHKWSASELMGLTDKEIFDEETAEHFVEYDQIAISMKEPFVFFEEVRDGEGNKRQLYTTKMTYVDANGRLCLQGFSLDVTDILTLQLENAKTKEKFKKVADEATIYARLQAITGNFIVVYVVDPETNHYWEFSSTEDYLKSFDRDKEGEDFFLAVRRDALAFTHPEDLERFLGAFTKENVMAEIKRSGIFTWGYRILMNGKPLHVHMKAAMVEEKDGERLIVGLNDIDTQVRQEEELEKRLVQAQIQASIDDLTGVKNRHAYLEMEALLDRQIANNRQNPFAIVLFDVNELKKVNDSFGHQYGDQYLYNASKVICGIFKQSPVFRVGGDEFVVIAQGHDYEQIDALMEKMNRYNEQANQKEGIVIACGVAKYENDQCVATVFERADQKMYENKHRLKSENDSH